MESSTEPPVTTLPLPDNVETASIEDSGGGTGVGGLSQLAMSMIGGGAATMPSAAPVPDVLLSLAKDDRYVSEVTSLLSQVAVPLASIFLLPWRGGGSSSSRGGGGAGAGAARRGDNNNDTTTSPEEILEDDGQRFIERIRPELNLLASIIVHSATFIFYTRNFGDGSQSNGDGIKRSLGMESLNLAYRYPKKKKPSSPTKNHTSNIGKTTIGNYLKRVFSLLELQRWQRLLLLQTMIPYIIHRVGRGGWSKDLGGYISTVMRQFGLGPLGSGISRTIANRSANGQGSEDDETVLRNNDRLRGLSRRRLFEEQRRRMLDSASNVSQANVESEPEADNSHVNGPRQEPSSPLNVHNRTTTLRSFLDNHSFDVRLRKLSAFSWNTMSRISLAVSSLSHGAHSLPRHMGVATGENLDRYAKIIRWFLRLHLALFYWNGVYPTFAHRLAGAKIRDDVAPYSAGSSVSPMSGAIVANRPTYKPLAALILFQAVAVLAQTTAEASIEVAHFVQVSFFRWRRRRRTQQQNEQQSGEASDVAVQHSIFDRASSERAEYMELIEERVPGIASSKNDTINAIHKSKSKKGKRRKETGLDIQPCGICLNERVDPAAPSVCGHVFCWNCILHWVSNVRAECPLCRAKTRPQEIIPLYNYP